MSSQTQNLTYCASDFGKSEEELMRKFIIQKDDAFNYFFSNIKPVLDRSYKLYFGYTGDRQKQIKRWQANVFVPYTQAVVETLVPRVLDARPEFTVQGRTEDDQMKAEKQQQLGDYIWELSGMDATTETLVRSTLVYGTGFLQVSWKKDVRKLKFLKTKDLLKKKYKYEEEERVFYDAPFCEWVDNYNLWYDWHNTDRKSKQYWFKRLLLTGEEIKRKYPNADKKRLEMALASPGGDLTDYAEVRSTVKANHDTIGKGDFAISGSRSTDKYNNTSDVSLNMYEVFEWWRPFADEYSVHVGGSYVPILKGAVMPIPYDFKEAPFIEFTYLKLPNEFEGVGLPMILENPQIMLNMIKNQRLDATTLSIHKMWIVNPLANINKEELVTRPFGIIYSTDPNGVREVEFSDIKSSAYREEDLLKSDMRYSSGVDDFSMGTGGGSSSATEVRHLRESTLERVRLFVNHLGEGYSDIMRYWMDMSRQFFTKNMIIRILGDQGELMFPLIEKDDLCGNFDYRATVLPSIAGQNDIKKKQDMDLFQLLVTLPFVDQRKLTSRVLQDWSWSLDSIAKSAEDEQAGMMPPEGEMPMDPSMMDPSMMDPSMMDPAMLEMMSGGAPAGPSVNTANIPPNVATSALANLRAPGEVTPQAKSPSAFSSASIPVDLLKKGPMPPTVQGVGGAGKGGPGKTTNTRGMNRTGRVNTNINMNGNSNPQSALLNRVFSLQK